MTSQKNSPPETTRLAQEVGQLQGVLPSLATKENVGNLRKEIEGLKYWIV